MGAGRRADGHPLLNPSEAAPWVSTNTTALYGLAAIQHLVLIGDRITAP